MKYIVKPAIKVYGKYIGEENVKIGLNRGTKYQLDEVSVTRDGNMYARAVIPVSGRLVTISSPISASKFEFVDEYGFKYEPPFRKGMCFKYQYDPYHMKDSMGTICRGPHVVIKYAYNEDSCDVTYVVYPKIGDNTYLMTPLFEGVLEYTSPIVYDTINGRITAASNNEANPTITYYLNKRVIATMKRTNDIYEFTRFWVNDTTSEVSSFTLSKFKSDFVVFTSNPSKYIDEKPGFSEAKLLSIHTIPVK